MRAIQENKRIRFYLSAMLLLLSSTFTAASAFDEWHYCVTAEEAGYSSDRLNEARIVFENSQGAAAFVVLRGKVLASWGNVETKYWTHSARKSFMSAIYGIHVVSGNIDLQRTLSDLDIDDDPLLTDDEKRARVIHLLKARSGVYHTAAAESQGMHDYKPARGTYGPDQHWCYNNWDFNTLVTIFNQETGLDFFEELKVLADKLGMQDFELTDTFYQYQYDRSIHPAYPFMITARDCARFGQLFLQNGVWNGEQLISSSWVQESTFAWSDSGDYIPGTFYSYMWWIYPKSYGRDRGLTAFGQYRSYAALGAYGQVILVIPDADMVFVHRVDSFIPNYVPTADIMELADRVLAAKEFDFVDMENRLCRAKPRSLHPGSKLTATGYVKNLSKFNSVSTTMSFYLSRNTILGPKDILIGAADVASIERGKMVTVLLKTTLPSDIKTKNYYLITQLDVDNLNHDPDQDNNISISAKKLKVKK